MSSAHAHSPEHVRPFPWANLDAVSPEDARAVRALHRWSRAFVRADEVADALSTLLDARVDVIVRRVRSHAGASRAQDEGVAVAVAASDAPELSDAAFLECERALGAALVARALRRSGPRVLDPASGAEALAGSVAAILLAAARRVHAGRALRVVRAGPARAIERELVAACGELIEASITVLLNEQAFAVRVLVPGALARAAPDRAWTRAALASLGDVPLSLPIVAAVSLSTAGEVGTLRRGDVWIPGVWTLRRTPSGALEGPVLLASASHETAVRAVLGDEGRLVVRDGTETLAWTAAGRAHEAASWGGGSEGEENRVSEAEKDVLVEAVGEVPVVVRVEIGVAEMRAREWASLAPGDVLSLGKRLGEPVTLRVGGITVARGELVDLDGEVAVRILGRTDGEPVPGPTRSPAKER
jgi:flagellar motor switch/type III secretory pathway protein FliN